MQGSSRATRTKSMGTSACVSRRPAPEDRNMGACDPAEELEWLQGRIPSGVNSFSRHMGWNREAGQFACKRERRHMGQCVRCLGRDRAAKRCSQQPRRLMRGTDLTCLEDGTGQPSVQLVEGVQGVRVVTEYGNMRAVCGRRHRVPESALTHHAFSTAWGTGTTSDRVLRQ
jgi:hypothetical protein